ncbi:MAG TPA: class II glutamine amidotransferase, partial [bacterium]|nr:class II glutamine amidotransferase [bacterium]
MCGIVGIHNHAEAANLAYLGLYALQHRGQESAGIVTSDGNRFYQHREMGLVADIFDQKNLKKLIGKNAIGHVRYSTSGPSSIENAQPFIIKSRGESMAIAHNGNLTNALCERSRLEEEGAIFQSSMDSEVIMHLIARERGGSVVERIARALAKVEGAYSLVFLLNGMMIAARDPKGFRPLSIGRFDDAYVVVSESCALDL